MTKLGQIFENACRLCGREPALLTPPVGWDVLAAMTLSAGIRTLAAEKFPMMQRIELRRYRPDWNEDQAYMAGQEVWYNGDYYRALHVVEGVAPTADTTVWRKLAMEEVWAFIHWDQPWENTVIDSAGVDATRFAYAADPKYHPNASPLKCTGVFEYGIEIAAPAPKEVFCRFVPVFPSVSFVPWVSGTMYKAGDVAYRAETKDLYRCVADVADGAANVAPEAAGEAVWSPVRVRDEFEPYLTRLVAADLMTDEQAKGMSRAAAERELELLCERYHEGNGETRVRLGRFR